MGESGKEKNLGFTLRVFMANPIIRLPQKHTQGRYKNSPDNLLSLSTSQTRAYEEF